MNPLPLPSKYFNRGLQTGYIITGLQMANAQVPVRTSRLARLNLIEAIKDRYYLSEKAGAYWVFSEVVKI